MTNKKLPPPIPYANAQMQACLLKLRKESKKWDSSAFASFLSALESHVAKRFTRTR